MTVKTYIRSILLGALVALSLVGFMIHARVHFIAQNPSFIVPFVAGILNIAVVPPLFWFKRTLAFGYVLNGFLCIIGTVTMGHFAIARWFAPTSPADLLLKSMVIDILIVWGKFFVGKGLFELETFGYDPNRPRAGITYRYPHMGWWLIHLAAVSLIYSITWAISYGASHGSIQVVYRKLVDPAHCGRGVFLLARSRDTLLKTVI